jgi:mannose-6-phosphate isomerase-like protein (cupin superfamily)
MMIPYRTLKNIGADILRVLQCMSPEAVSGVLTMVDYHGFWKSRLPHNLLQPVLGPYRLQPHELQIEIVKVDTDLTAEVHYHEFAHAVIYALGEGQGFDAASRALAFQEGEWRRIQSGAEIDIPPGTPHGFTVERGGVLWFLSVQAPPIVSHVGADDYHHVVPVAADLAG